MRSDQPPGYPFPPPPFRPTFRQRKSATIISISSLPPEGESSIVPSTAPMNTSAFLATESQLSTRLATTDAEVPFHSSGPPGPSSRPSSCPPAFCSFDGNASTVRPATPSGPLPSGSALPGRLRPASMERKSSDASSLAEEGESTLLLGENRETKGKWYEGPVLVAAVRFGVLFFIFTGLVAGTFYFGMPKLEPEDKGVIKLPRSFADLQSLNTLFQKYKALYPFRMLACGVVSYLFVQAFTLPGSMYISILFGAAYGMIYGIFLSCVCEATGALLCYTLSAILAPPLLALPFYRARVETWRIKIMGDPSKGKEVSWDGVLAFLMVLRIAPFPPHWIANFVAPHLGIHPFLFWSSAFIGIAPVSVIHVTIGMSLETMTSAADFHILSLRNILGLVAVVVAVLIPVGLKRVFKNDLGELGEAETVLDEAAIDTREVSVPALHPGHVNEAASATPRRYQAIDSGVVLAGPSAGDPDLDIGLPRTKSSKGKGRAIEIITAINEDDEYDVYGTSEGRGGSGSRRGSVDKARARFAPLKGYGTIEPVVRDERNWREERDGRDERDDRAVEIGQWWLLRDSAVEHTTSVESV